MRLNIAQKMNAHYFCCCNSIRESGWHMRKAKCYINTLTSPSTIKLPLVFIIKVVKSAFYGRYQNYGMRDKTSTKISIALFSLGEI